MRSSNRIAHPSMAELRCAGTLTGETMSSARTAQCIAYWHAGSAGNGRKELMNERTRLGDRHGVRVVVVGAGGLGDGEGRSHTGSLAAESRVMGVARAWIPLHAVRWRC